MPHTLRSSILTIRSFLFVRLRRYSGLGINHSRFMQARTFLLMTIAAHAAILHSQTLSLLSGHGQVIPEQSIATKPFVVRALDASGNPMANVPITWSVTPMGAGTLRPESAQTNSEGVASTGFFASSNQPGVSFVPATITATSPNGEVNFTDLVLLSQNYNKPIPALGTGAFSASFEQDLAAAFAQVPEPSALAGVGLAAAGLMGRRRRK